MEPVRALRAPAFLSRPGPCAASSRCHSACCLRAYTTTRSRAALTDPAMVYFDDFFRSSVTSPTFA